MDLQKIKLEHVLFLLAFLIGLGVRLLNLGAVPLSDAEATWALQALHIARGLTAAGTFTPGPQPGYLALTGALFAVVEANNALARLWPALAGSLLVFLPLLFRPQIPRNAGLILAFALALDPGLVTASRMVGSPIPALSFSLLAAGWFYQRKPILAGIFLGLAMLSGPSFIMGLTILGISWLIYYLTSRTQLQSEENELFSLPSLTRQAGVTIFITAGITLVLFATIFLLFRQGLAAWAGSIGAFLQGLLELPVVPPQRLIAILLVFQIFPVIFALLRIIASVYQRNFSGITRLLTIWLVTALVMLLIYPSRQAIDLVWVIVPLWGLAAIEMDRLFQGATQPLVALGEAALIVILSGLLWFNLAGLSRGVPDPTSEQARYILMLGVIGLWALTAILVTLGWSWSTARLGLALGLALAASLYTFSAMWGAAQERFNQPQELWNSSSAAGQADLLLKTIKDLSEWTVGTPQGIDIQIAANSPALEWLLRDYTNIKVVSALPSTEQPALIITHQEDQPPALTAAYRGQDFDWWIYPGWTGPLPSDLTSWLTFRNAPLQTQQIILWARSDLFPGAAPLSSNQPAP